jgi:hypothetical protein
MARGSSHIFKAYKKNKVTNLQKSISITPVLSKDSDWSVVLRAISIESNLTPNRLPICSPSPENRLARPIRSPSRRSMPDHLLLGDEQSYSFQFLPGLSSRIPTK